MMLKPLACVALSAALLSACSVLPTSHEPIVFKEPTLSAPFYALNPFNYAAPSAFELDLKKAENGKNRLIVPATNSNTREISYAKSASSNQVDVTEIDDFLQMVEGKARHYPPRFTERQERKGFEQKLKQVNQQLEALTAKDNASFDVLIRAFKASVMARNLDLGSAYTTKSMNYAQRLQKLNKNDPELNFWFGFALSEGGGQREAISYLDKAMKGGVQEAYLSATNNYLAMEQKKNAVQTLKNYKLQYPQEANVADRLINEIEKKGRWNVWQVMNPTK
ncbi:hypothetical protein SKM54_03665 [Acinetobacter faecalis]|uniref:ABUW_2363 family tetratricopeptide repeat lipoprotein n=1 Tax=Acinetobacter faecalis TaxID=2665161 RepID=UPI002A92012B|nr:hypothetical protein [Acinetobacter faecalis]MDY6481544.1 hypothetical protein [Acinetobacter faecalis]